MSIDVLSGNLQNSLIFHLTDLGQKTRAHYQRVLLIR